MKKGQYKEKIQLKKTEKNGHLCILTRKYSTERVITAIGTVRDTEGASKSKARLTKVLDKTLTELYIALEAGSTVSEAGFERNGKVVQTNKGEEIITYQYIIFKDVDEVEVSLTHLVDDVVHNAEKEHGTIAAYIDSLVTKDVIKHFVKK